MNTKGVNLQMVLTRHFRWFLLLDMAKAPKTVPDIIDAFGGPTNFAKTLKLKRASTATQMKRRGTISGKFWLRISKAAKRRGIPGITPQTLAEIHDRIG